MSAIGLAVLSAALFGAMTVALRLALRGGAPAELGALATVVPALAVVLGAAGIEAAAGYDLRLEAAWPFALAGVLAPGGSQLLFTLAVRDAGPSRTSVAVGAAPLVSVAIALALLDEPVRAPLLIGALLVVSGGVALARERGRPEHVRLLGLGFAAGAAILFATRDNLVRWLAGPGAPRPSAAAAATLLTGLVVALAATRGRRPGGRELRAFLPAGVCFGLSYLALFEAYYRGRVTVVSPLVATESLWGVGLSVLLLQSTELVGRRLVMGALLVVAGGVLIGLAH